MSDSKNSGFDPVLIVFVAIVAGVAAIGAYFQPGTWYETIEKPAWTPPNYLFGPVWSLLYLMIAVAGWRAWEAAPPCEGVVAFSIFGLQLALNAGWSAIFFGMRRMRLALYEVGLLWASILATIVAFYPIDSLAAWLLLPYLAWVSFAAVLNFAIWRMNA